MLSDVTTGDPTLRIVGFRNFRLILEDSVFRLSLKNTFFFAITSQVIVILLSRIIATALMKEFRGKWLALFLIMLPWMPIASDASVALHARLDLQPLRLCVPLCPRGALLGPMPNLYWLGQPALAMASVITVHIWRLLPLATVIQLAGLSSIPRTSSSGRRGGRGHAVRRTLMITIPLTMPIVSIAFLFGLVFTFTDMTVVYVLTRGGPVHTTQVLSTWTFFKGIEGGDLAQGRPSPSSCSRSRP